MSTEFKIMCHTWNKRNVDNITNHIMINNTDKSLCGKTFQNISEQQENAKLCKACIHVLERREKEQIRRNNGTHGAKTSIFKRNYFDLYKKSRHERY